MVKGRSSPGPFGILTLRLLGNTKLPSKSFLFVTSNQLSEIPESVSSSTPGVDIPGLLFI